MDESEYTTYPLGSIVYAIQTAPGRVKLGYTTNLSLRMHAILGNAGEATLLRYEAASMDHERRLQHACRAHHLTHEFFVNEGAVSDYVAGNFSVLDLGPAPRESERYIRLHYDPADGWFNVDQAAEKAGVYALTLRNAISGKSPRAPKLRAYRKTPTGNLHIHISDLQNWMSRRDEWRSKRQSKRQINAGEWKSTAEPMVVMNTPMLINTPTRLPSDTRTCQRCHGPLDCTARSDAKFCSGRCRVAAHRAPQVALSPVPSTLRGKDRWVRRDAAKRPLTVQGRSASSTNARTWSTFAAASAARDVGDGLGFVLNGDGVVCLDLDGCLDDGGLAPWAATVLASCPATYIEVSPSGRGLHVWGTGDVPAGRVLAVDGGKVELYGSGRYMTCTGQPYAGAPSLLADLTATIAQVTHH